jgi:hypothetical protein
LTGVNGKETKKGRNGVNPIAGVLVDQVELTEAKRAAAAALYELCVELDRLYVLRL